jgi:UDP-glucose 4-epimerase
MLQILCDTHGVDWTIAVPHNIIGSLQKYDDPFRNVVSIFLNRMMQNNPPINLWRWPTNKMFFICG